MSYEAATEAGVTVVEDSTFALVPAPGAEDGLLPGLADMVIISLGPEGAVSSGSGALLLCRKRSLLADLKGAAGNVARHAQLPNMGAALALAQMGDIDADRARRLEIESMYRASLARSRHEALVAPGESGTAACSFVVKLKDSLGEVRQYARKHGVETRPAFEDSCIAAAEELHEACPGARKLLLCCLLFPLYSMLSRRDAESICRVLATLP
jgi:dTDP-4-amino-4,6-dideoxygalactose transaminase